MLKKEREKNSRQRLQNDDDKGEYLLTKVFQYVFLFLIIGI